MKQRVTRRPKTFDIAAFVVHTLNVECKGDSEVSMQAELRRLVSLWLESGPNTEKLMRDHPDLIPERVPCFLIPSGRKLEVSFQPGAIAVDQSPEKRALALLLQLLTTGASELRLCACGCRQFFLLEKKYKKTYIRGHASRVSASKRMREIQARKRAPRIRAVNRVLAKYKGLSVNGDWKEFVERETNFMVSIPTLSRWAEKGWIHAPAKEG